MQVTIHFHKFKVVSELGVLKCQLTLNAQKTCSANLSIAANYNSRFQRELLLKRERTESGKPSIAVNYNMAFMHEIKQTV